jgi:AcrR family transcriptional regulator
MSVKRPIESQNPIGPDSPSRPSARVRNPQGQGGRLRLELIAAADRILAQTGDVEALSLRAVAREVGIATPSIYLHFPDKQALVQAVLVARFAELEEAVRTAVVGASGPAEHLRAGCLAYCRFATENPNAYRVLFGRRPPPQPEADEASADGLTEPPPATPPLGQRELTDTSKRPHGGFAGAAAFGFLVDGVGACIRAGIARPGDPFSVAINVWTAMHGIVSLRGTAPRFPWPPLERQLDDMLIGLVGLHHNPPTSEG